MTSSVSHRLETPCGFEIWIIPTPDSVFIRVFFGNQEVGLDGLNKKISKEGALQLADKLKQALKGE